VNLTNLVSGGRLAHAAVLRLPPNPSYTIVARVVGYTYDGKVWALWLSFKRHSLSQEGGGGDGSAAVKRDALRVSEAVGAGGGKEAVGAGGGKEERRRLSDVQAALHMVATEAYAVWVAAAAVALQVRSHASCFLPHGSSSYEDMGKHRYCPPHFSPPFLCLATVS
jgi:hypothetical protein